MLCCTHPQSVTWAWSQPAGVGYVELNGERSNRREFCVPEKKKREKRIKCLLQAKKLSSQTKSSFFNERGRERERERERKR